MLNNNGSANWKERFSEILSTCQDELKKTTEIGKKMLTAGRVNSGLREHYEELGKLVLRDLESNDLKWSNVEADAVILKIKKCEKDLESIEQEVQDIKGQSEDSLK